MLASSPNTVKRIIAQQISTKNGASLTGLAKRFKSSGAGVRHITKISDLSRPEIASILSLAMEMRATPSDYHDALKHKTLLMLFEKPSLRTRVSLEAGMTSLGGHGIAYMTGDSPIGKKETYEDTGAVLSRMSDAVTARVKSREQIAGLAANSTIPIVNALDDYAHVSLCVVAVEITYMFYARWMALVSLLITSILYDSHAQNSQCKCSQICK